MRSDFLDRDTGLTTSIRVPHHARPLPHVLAQRDALLGRRPGLRVTYVGRPALPKLSPEAK
jgi:hypothetical protein